MEDGMTGIGSRRYWLNGREGFKNLVLQSEDIEKDNHFLYRLKWRDDHISFVHLLICESELGLLLSEENEWRCPEKIIIGVE
jgi:hypothetical protein